MTAPVYFIAHLQVTDADEYRKYEKAFFPVLKEYDAQFVTFEGCSCASSFSEPGS